MKKARAKQVNEHEQQAAAQNDGAHSAPGEQNVTAQENEIRTASDVAGLSAETQSDNDIGDDEYAASVIRQEVPSMRDMFAAAALQGMLANGTHMQRPDAVAYKAYEYADAMLAVRGE